jgi:hypothetical protein
MGEQESEVEECGAERKKFKARIQASPFVWWKSEDEETETCSLEEYLFLIYKQFFNRIDEY